MSGKQAGETAAGWRATSWWVGVVAIVAGLFVWALTYDVGGNDFESAKTAVCISNVKELGTALSLYAENSDGRLPDSSTWMNELQPYMKNERILHCPALLANGPGAYGYAMNFEISGKEVARIANPDGVPALFESVLMVRNATSGFYGLPDPRRHRNWRGNCTVVGFLDGHVEQVRRGGVRP